MRLLALTTSFPLRPDASAGVFVRRLYEHFPDDWRIDVVCPADDAPATASEPAGSRIRVRPVRYAPRQWRVLAQQAGGVASSLRRAPWRILLAPMLLIGLWWRCVLDARRCDLLHANWAICGAIAAAAAAGRCPVVTTLRGDDVTRARRSLVDRWVLNLAVRGSALVVCVAEAMAAELRALFPNRSDDIRVCLNGVDSAFLAVVRSAPERGRLRVAAAGSLIRRKGYDVLIEAIARMRHRDAIDVRIAGAGPELEPLRRQAAQLGVADRIDFVGDLPPARIPQFLADADVFVLPSRSEGRPNAVVEALAAGLPVISSALPGVEGLVAPGVNGWSFAVDDVGGLAAALDEAYADATGRERRAAEARAGIVRAGFTWAATGAQYDGLFRRAIELQRTGAS